jgi:protein-S-isoprenylcysteine O-methyltransferase Ste14
MNDFCSIPGASRVNRVKLRVPPPLIALVAAVLMCALHRWMPGAHIIPPPWNRFGALAAGVGIGIDLTAIRCFRQARTTVNPMDPSRASRLVTGGIFSISRNPMYLGLFLLLIGWALWLGTASAWLVPPLFLVVTTYAQIVPEERALTRLFGAQYVAYRRDVARWLGRRAN